ncbi:hypothetical protein TSAR_011033 [Trichomalopsis sarcophagae]|uniref:Uncharacterized protein n=1 Tax=Trichomalopsis sarcophagae TaxID=543379 RepID=A0A232EU06_9HYME|nr:hypothetical protein TSAR_011033 [Trichomalopsis sarcophagae]
MKKKACAMSDEAPDRTVCIFVFYEPTYMDCNAIRVVNGLDYLSSAPFLFFPFAHRACAVTLDAARIITRLR